MRYLTLSEVLELHQRVVRQSGGAGGIRDLGGLESAVAQPQMSFAGTNLYSSLQEAATALCYSLVMNHAFIDGNKRIGHAAMETFLVLNGYELICDVDEAETTILRLAAGEMTRDDLLTWVRTHASSLKA